MESIYLYQTFPTLVSFIESFNYNAWLESFQLKIYVRKGWHSVDGSVRSCLDVANIVVEPQYQKQGLFKTWIERAEQVAAKHDFYCVYVESIHNDHLSDYLTKRGYKWTTDNNSMYLPLRKTSNQQNEGQ